MKVIGLTGGSGCGKSLFSLELSRYGIVSLDTDYVYHYLTDHPSPCVAEVSGYFGKSVLKDDGSLDRKKLSEIVFHDDTARSERLRILGELTHKYIKAECLAWLDNQRRSGARYAVIDAPVLFESGFNELCDMTVAVISDVSVRIRRIAERDGITAEAAARRIAAQPDETFYRARADYILENNGDAEAFSATVTDFYRRILLPVF